MPGFAMNWGLVLLAATGAVAAPVVAGVVAPDLLTGAAESGFAIHHRRFVFDETFRFHAQGVDYVVHLADGDLYELPLTTQAVLRGSVSPAPSANEVEEAIARTLEHHKLPVLSYRIDWDGERVEVKATLPAGVLANLSPRYGELLEKYEA